MKPTHILSILAMTFVLAEATPCGAQQDNFSPLADPLGGSGYADGAGSAARFSLPSGIAVDSAGNVYVGEYENHTIRKITPTGVVSTLAGLAGFAGSADGTGSAARFASPLGVAVDSAGNVYVADWGSTRIRKITPGGVVSTLAVQFDDPSGVAVDSAGNVYVVDNNHSHTLTIWKITPGGVVNTLAALRGNGGNDFYRPSGVAVDGAGNVYVADGRNSIIQKITPAGVVNALAGLAGNGNEDGTSANARFAFPSGVAVDSGGNVYVADAWNNTIRKITPGGMVSTLAGDGTGSDARFDGPSDVAVDSAGNVYVADSRNHTIRKITPGGAVSTLAGLAEAIQCQAQSTYEPYAFSTLAGKVGYGNADGIYGPQGVAVDSAGNVYLAAASDHTIRKVTPAGVVTTVAGVSGSVGSADGTGSDARFNGPSSVAVDSSGSMYVADSGNSTIRKVTPAGVVTTLTGVLGGAGVAVDVTGNLYVADDSNHTIRKVTPAGVVTTLAGLAGSPGSSDGTGSDAQFSGPAGVAVDSAGNVYVAERVNCTIRKVTPAGVVTTLAGLAGNVGCADGTGSTARFGGHVLGEFGKVPVGPTGVAVDSAGNVYVADYFNQTIRKVTPAGVVTTLAGLARSSGSADGTGSGARFYGPWGVAVDTAGNVYVSDLDNNTIRKGFLAPRILNSGPGFGFNGGQFSFSLTGPAGRLVVVEASTDLMSWLPLWTNTFTAALNFSDSQSGGVFKRFYRARLP